MDKELAKIGMAQILALLHPPPTLFIFGQKKWASRGRGPVEQGGRSCAGAREAPAEKFGLGRKF